MIPVINFVVTDATDFVIIWVVMIVSVVYANNAIVALLLEQPRIKVGVAGTASISLAAMTSLILIIYHSRIEIGVSVFSIPIAFLLVVTIEITHSWIEVSMCIHIVSSFVTVMIFIGTVLIPASGCRVHGVRARNTVVYTDYIVVVQPIVQVVVFGPPAQMGTVYIPVHMVKIVLISSEGSLLVVRFGVVVVVWVAIAIALDIAPVVF